MAIPLVKLTLFVPLLLKLTAPVSTLFCVKVIGLAPAVKLDVPGTVKDPVCVIAPVAVTVKFWPTLEAANTVAMLLVKLTLFVPVLLTVTAPVKALLCVRVIAFAPALKLEVPETVSTPVCVMAPEDITIKLLPIVDVPKTNGKD